MGLSGGATRGQPSSPSAQAARARSRDELLSQRYKRGSTLIITNLPLDEWIGVLLDRLIHHVHILEMKGESSRLKYSKEIAASKAPDGSG